jgi:ketosteroid isomerase-like protein
MTTEEVQDFVTRFAAAWATRDGNSFLELWHPDGTLTTPLVDRPVKGSELAKLIEVQTVSAPDFVWQLLDWTSRGNVVTIEWQTTRHVEGRRFEWRGIDKFRLSDGKIAQEVVYSDTAPLRAFRSGERLEPITRF